MTTDVKKIAVNTGLKEEDIRKIKEYLFVDKHNLLDGRYSRFDPDFMIAISWQRLMQGNIENHDITLLRHELMEMQLIEKGMSQDEAHTVTSRIYNYDKEANEFHGNDKKHKD